MTIKVVWDDEALDDLEEIGAHIRSESPGAASRVVEYIRNKSLLLETSPMLGRPNLETKTRTLTLSRYPYVPIYEVEDGEVRILAIFHQAQDRT